MRYFLKLFVTGHTPNSLRAIRSVKMLLDEELPGSYNLTIIDVLKHVGEAMDYEILATPTLVRALPLPPRRVIGDLSNRDKVFRGLDLTTAPMGGRS